MSRGALFNFLVCSLSLAVTTIGMPMTAPFSIRNGSMISAYDKIDVGSHPLEIRGVYGGRKRRYIIEKAKPGSCPHKCKEKPICLPTFGEIIKDCRCQKCLTGVPDPRGNFCQETCPEGQEKNGKGGCCPIGQKPKAQGDGCEKTIDDDRKGKCPGDKVLDPKEGWDPKVESPKCQIDDEKDCPKPKIPATRPDGMENDASFKVACGEPEKDGPKCNEKTQYAHVYVDSEGKATRTCKQTKKYQERKRTKPTTSDLRTKIKDSWNKLKPEYDKRNRERQESLDKLKRLEEERNRRAKELGDKARDADNKKKERQAKCNTHIALLMGATSGKLDGEHPYDWTTDYFDEEFVSSDERLQDWPDEINVDEISSDVNVDAFLKKWDEYIDDRMRPVTSCWSKKRSLARRCPQRKSLDEGHDDLELATHSTNVSSFYQGHTVAVQHLGHLPRSTAELEKRNPLVILILSLSGFFTRVAVQLVARAAASIAARAPRLASLAKNPDRLFQVAARGQGAKSGQQGMKDAAKAIRQDYKRWAKCLKEGVP